MECVRIVDVIDSGTVIVLLVQYCNGKLGRIVFDHRPFWHWFEATGLNRLGRLIGMWVGVAGEWGSQTITLPARTRRELVETLEEVDLIAEERNAHESDRTGNHEGGIREVAASANLE